MSKHKKVIAILQQAKKQIEETLTEPEDQVHAIRLSHTLDFEANRIGLLTGTGDIVASTTERPGPATTILGVAIDKEVTEAEDLEPKKDKVADLKAKVEEAYSLFPTKGNEDILKDLDDTVIRGVAKKAGLKVTKDNPENLTVEFIEQVKEAINKKK